MHGVTALRCFGTGSAGVSPATSLSCVSLDSGERTTVETTVAADADETSALPVSDEVFAQ
jgi:hypothetical protein